MCFDYIGERGDNFVTIGSAFVRYQCLLPLNVAAEPRSRGVGGLGIATQVMTGPEATK